MAPNENIPNLPLQAPYPAYGGNYGPTQEATVPVYQQPYIVYTPYTVPVQYEPRNVGLRFVFKAQMRLFFFYFQETPMHEMSGYYVNIPADSAVNSAVQPLTYQSQPLWNQQQYFYPNVTPSPSQRYSVPMQNPSGKRVIFKVIVQVLKRAIVSGTYLPTATYPTNFVQQTLPPQPPQNTADVLPVYPQQPIHVVYPANSAQPNGMVYPNQGVVCNTQMYAPLYPTQTISYPQNTSTPNSCTSSVSNTAFCGQLADMNTAQSAPQLPNYATHLVHNMSQMSLNSTNPVQSYNNQGSKLLVQNIGFDGRSQKASPPRVNKFNNPRGFLINSSQSSTGTSSPATTVVASYCNNQSTNMYRTPPPPETPTMQHPYGSNYMQPFMVRQVTIFI